MAYVVLNFGRYRRASVRVSEAVCSSDRINLEKGLTHFLIYVGRALL